MTSIKRYEQAARLMVESLKPPPPPRTFPQTLFFQHDKTRLGLSETDVWVAGFVIDILSVLCPLPVACLLLLLNTKYVLTLMIITWNQSTQLLVFNIYGMCTHTIIITYYRDPGSKDQFLIYSSIFRRTTCKIVGGMGGDGDMW